MLQQLKKKGVTVLLLLQWNHLIFKFLQGGLAGKIYISLEKRVSLWFWFASRCDWWRCTSFHVLTGHSCLFLSKMSVHIYACFLNWVSVFLFLSPKGVFYILDGSPLSDTWFANVSSQAATCLFIVLTVSLEEQMLLILIMFNLSFFFFYRSCFWCHA